MKEQTSELENNIFFWQKLDTLILSGNVEAISKAGTPSPDYPKLVYPVDFGKVSDVLSNSGAPFYCFIGSLKDRRATAVIVQADILEREVFVKALIGCTEDEIRRIIKFINAAEFQKAILVRRGSDVPGWAHSDQ
ncbi:Inorganic pyrophosphatase [Allobaculum mucilyticum]|uniref:Inorganic pyrophosphatase n=1 Tax=Allobaculum mucilyticum TaxID=2834459 RepID=UPI001E4C9183|nr:Inorganic pyrophosphatase [Allobaculum mucilyticum]UNT95248.1 Inorganic pyrophosphatase [Allobaculum mucilyticum]